ncbi:trans-cinnamate:CoA ligase, peroxisomal [Elaeis guineensis]|uniref:Butyrate--CoA ligase AAE11, peroxisomal n=1 Tax=Elaeis guineensis var. tenera TaxID=51953 RepID=A0A6I9QGG3_ELAGV|nr:butyrate--CoA ligase AAE11, peroxisomal [Elaeis guineensis]
MDRLPKCEANYGPLSPVTFLERAAKVYADRTSVIYENTRFTWKQTYDRCRRLASSLRSLNISKNDVVSVLAPNIPAVYEMHFAVPMAGAVLNTINTRLDANNIAAILVHSDAKAFFIDHQYTKVAREALKRVVADIGERHPTKPLPFVVIIDEVHSPASTKSGELHYEQLIACGNPLDEPHRLEDEWDAIALNYTSGTTAAPKGVVYSHRGAFLSSLTVLLQWQVPIEPVYLWTLPMFHCNGWGFAWGIAARGGTNVCIRTLSAAAIYGAIAAHGVTHMCCAPVVFNILLHAPPADRRTIPGPVQVLTGGAPPPAALLESMEKLGFHVSHAYGMTEATATALVCEWRPQWDRLPQEAKARLKARQGVSVLTLADMDVIKNRKSMSSVPRDGKSLGEIVLKGSSVMKGYYKNKEGTDAAFQNGWFWTGDVGVVHPDGYVEVKDRAKDVIISGGENISSVEVESVLYRHQMVLEAAVVAMPHPHWGETPCAFLTLKPECKKGSLKEEDVIAYCKASMPGFMVPKKVVFLAELPKAGPKIQKFQLRAIAKRLAPTHATEQAKAQPKDQFAPTSRL